MKQTSILVARILLLLLFAGAIQGTSHAIQGDQEEPEFSDQQLEFFESQVRPILVKRCFECHSGEEREGGLNVESRISLLEGGDTGPAIVPGKPDESLIIDAINYGDLYEMPPSSKLPQKEIEALTRWVKDGAAWPKSSDIAVARTDEFDIKKRKEEHWCWSSISRPAVPVVSSNWTKDPLDNFIYKQVSDAGLTVAPQADRATLLRRASFDLIGLPPSKDQIQQFVVDQSISFEQLVDELLASPHFGERWARHWMDLVRYAETCGHEFDYPLPNAFQYRDYLIRAFNQDVAYDKFIKEHIAGDLLPSPRRNPTDKFNESILGTGFWFLGEATHGPVDVKGNEAGHIDNQIDVMSKTFLGLTVACARCHDHMFDAISTKDYYALSGFLQSSRRQNAMIDKGRKIEKGVQKISPLVAQSNQLVLQLADRLGNGDEVQLSSYLSAAITVIRSDQKWFMPASLTIQGESMKSISNDSGIVDVQHIPKRNGFTWQGDRHLWWRDGKEIGQKWVVEFNITQSGKFDLSATMTIAADYGAATIQLNDSPPVSADFYAKDIGTKEIELGTFDLESGKHKLTFSLTEPNEKAIKRNMIGLDCLRLDPVVDPGTLPKSIDLEKYTREKNLEADVLRRLIKSLNNINATSPNHPLYAVGQLLDGKKPVTEKRIQAINKTIENDQRRADETRTQATKFASFDNDFEGWMPTGRAFGAISDQPTLVHSEKLEVVPGGVATSGGYGSNFLGVLRSPTFEIKHSHIHYRIRSQKARLRLVIDGFVMDEYNALLFSQALIKDATHPEFTWRTQAGDIRNYIGHRAHLEIVDNGAGFAAIDEIWFSNGAAPQEYPSSISKKLLGKPIASIEELSDRLSAEIIKSVSTDAGGNDQATLLTWIIQNDLGECFGNTSESNVSVGNLEKQSNTQNIMRKLEDLHEEIRVLASKVPRPELAPAITDGSPENENVFIRGNHKTLGEVAPRQFLEAIVGEDADRFDGLSGSGRLELAKQIASGTNPLTSRVIVNRLWHHLTGRGIVASVDNFGVLGKEPTNQQLLDYLAVEFVEDDWSIKRMLKRIMLSSTYQMSSQLNPAADTIDPDNNLMHRAHIRRLQGEAIRDSMLFISGQLDSKLYGRSVPIHLTPFMQGRGRPGRSGPVDGDRRRSVYIEVRRNFLSPMMLAFDTPIPFNTIGRRNLSNVPAQALILMNDPFVIGQSRKWAESVLTNSESIDERIESIYLSAFAREPNDKEIRSAKDFIEKQSKELGKPKDSPEVWADFCHVIFNVKEFIFLK